MSKEYIIAAERINQLADECSEDYDLACILRAGSSKLMKLAENVFIKDASVKKVNEDETTENS